MHKALPGTTLHYKACTKYSAVLLCSTKIAQNTSLHCKACTKHFPVLLCTTKLAQKQAFTQRGFTQRNFLVHNENKIAAPKPDLRAKAKKHDCEALFKRNLKGKSPAPKLRKSADKSLSQPRCSHSTMIYNAQLQKTINSINSTTHAAAAPSNLDAAIVYNAILRYWTAKHNRIIATAWEIAPPKPDLGAKAEKKILKHFWKGIFKGKSQAPKLRKSADKSLSQPWCSHSITIYDVQLQKTIVLCMQPRHQATLTQPLYTMRFWDIELQSTIELSQQREKLHLQNRISAPKRKKRFWTLLKRNFQRKITSA